MRIGLSLLLVDVIVLGAVSPAFAAQQGAAAAQYHRLELKREPKLAPGAIGAVRGQVDGDGERIVVDRLSVMQPVVVAVLAGDADRPLQLEIVKGTWDEAVRTIRTDAQGVARTQFRTQESFGMRVSALRSERAAYSLLVWAGEEPSAQPVSIFAAARPGAAASGAVSSGVTPGSGARHGQTIFIVAGIAAALVIAAALLWFIARRRDARGG